MRSAVLASILVSVALVACVSGGADDGSSNDQDLTVDSGGVSTDGGAPASDAGPGMSDGGTSVTDAGTTGDIPTYAEVGPIINTVCGECHMGKFSTLAKVKVNKTKMLGVISAGRMPKNNPGWKNTAAGQDVLDFLAHSPEL